MPTYTYADSEGREHEVTQRIVEKAYDWRDPLTGEWGHDKPGEPKREGWQVQRLITGAPQVHLIPGASGGWSETGYSLKPHQAQAEQVLGRKLMKAAR